MSNQDTCPRCNGRLLSGAKNCLSCGALVAPGRSEAAEGGSSSLMPIIVVLMVLGGGAMIFVFGAGASKTVDAVRTPVTFDGSNVTATVCVSEDDTERIDDMQSQGWAEIDGKSGMRCFQD